MRMFRYLTDSHLSLHYLVFLYRIDFVPKTVIAFSMSTAHFSGIFLKSTVLFCLYSFLSSPAFKSPDIHMILNHFISIQNKTIKIQYEKIMVRSIGYGINKKMNVKKNKIK